MPSLFLLAFFLVRNTRKVRKHTKGQSMKMEVSTMTSKGQITIPVAVRKKLDLQQGDKVVFIEDDSPNGGIRILNAATLSFGKNGEAVTVPR